MRQALAAAGALFRLLVLFSTLLSQVVISINLLSNAATSPSPVSPVEWYALLDLKAHITKSNTSEVLLSAWNVSNLHNICDSWAGVTCTSSDRRHIAGIELAGFGLAGSLSPHLGNLTFISTLNLSSNQFSREIPQHLSACSSLKVLDLDNNLLTGPIPPSLSSLSNLRVLRLCNNRLIGHIPPPLFTNCTSLIELSLYSNALVGSIPTSDWRLPTLQYLRLGNNHLSTGSIPPSIGNCSNLIALGLANNFFLGEIPSEVGSLTSLSTLRLNQNNLTGSIPQSLGNCSKLQYLWLSNNNLTGVIPSSLARCKKLQQLGLESNHLTGGIPTELGRLTYLTILHLDGNNLMGHIPRSLSNCTRLVELQLSSNQLSGLIPTELAHLAQLQCLHLSGNLLTGIIPPTLANCTQLDDLSLVQNQLSGFIPNGIMKLKHLQNLDLSSNQLVGFERPFINIFDNTTSLIRLELAFNLIAGSIPTSLGQLQGLQGLYLGHNQFTGMIPWDFLSNCTSLNRLRLSYNNLSGSLSSQIRKLSHLEDLRLNHNLLEGPIPDFANPISSLLNLDLSFNQLNGSLPDSLANALKNVQTFDFSHNDFSGELPPWLGGTLMMVTKINLSHNHFTGAIPDNLGDCQQLEYLNLSHNRLEKEIPSHLGNMSSLISLDLSNNNLTGMLPPSLGQLQRCNFIDVSFNDLEGFIPISGVFKHVNASSFQGNPGLCGPLIDKPCTKSHYHAQLLGWKRSFLFALASLVITIALIAICFAHKYQHSRSQRANLARSSNLSLGETRHFSAVELSESTKGYSEANLLGKGALGVVYKGVLPYGEIVAIKKFRNLTCAHGAFLQELHIMSKIRHRNLVKVLGYVLNLEEQALVLEFMPNGSLEKYLQECKTSYGLSLTMIIKIARAVANGLAYLHHEYDVASIIHGDVKPSNILLDSDFEARLADFGLAKLAKRSTGEVSLSCNIEGSIGYMAPEYAYAAKISTKVDIYSFGVVVQEMITGKGPTHELLHGVTLHEWVKHKLMLSHGSANIREIVHPSLLVGASATEFDDSRARHLLQMAIACTNVLPDKRPTMHDVKLFLDAQLVACVPHVQKSVP